MSNTAVSATAAQTDAATNEVSLDIYEQALAAEVPGLRSALLREEAATEACMRLRGELRQLRTSLGKKQEEIAELLEMSQSAISHVETGRGDIGFMTICRYASVLGLQPTVTFVPNAASFRKHDALPNLLLAIKEAQAQASYRGIAVRPQAGSVQSHSAKGSADMLLESAHLSPGRLTPHAMAEWKVTINSALVRNNALDVACLLSAFPHFGEEEPEAVRMHAG